MAVINRVIGQRDYEIIRDKIGEIIADELINQAVISYDELLEDVPVFIQRSKPINHDEYKLINVTVDSIEYSNQTVISAEGAYTYFIDIVCTAVSTDSKRGDIASNYDAQRLAGVVCGILEDTQYKTLGFTPPFIGRAHISSISPGTISRGESTELNVIRLTLNVMSNQTEPGIEPVPLHSATTKVKLNQTDNGYCYIYEV